MRYISGARVDNIMDSNARKIAADLYKEFRNQKYDFVNVSKNTGMSIEYTQMIKNYLFRDFHIQFNGTERFLPVYDIAQSWKRLSSKSGHEILHHDLVLLNHELLEIKLLINTPNLLQIQAHALANRDWNYQEASNAYYKSIGVKIG